MELCGELALAEVVDVLQDRRGVSVQACSARLTDLCTARRKTPR
jgi:hypothetical protein